MRRVLSAPAVLVALVAALAGCERDFSTPPPPPPEQLSLDAELRRAFGGWGVIPLAAVPAQNPALVQLGRALVFDKVLSGNRDIACVTCHSPALAAGDGRSLGVGTGGTGTGVTRTLGAGRQLMPRNAPDLMNRGLGLYRMFWDGRVALGGPAAFSTPAGTALPPGLASPLAAQAMFPVVSREEMRGERGDRDVFGNPNELAELGDTDFTGIWRAVMQRLLAIDGYVAMFNAAFPGTPTNQLGFQHAANAIAAFQLQTLSKVNSPFDRFVAGDNGAMSGDAKRGALLFFGRARCSSCHSGPMLTSLSFANVGVPQLGPGKGAAAPLDVGAAEVLNNQFYRFAFRVAPLRNVELTAPYMHNGAFPTLESVVLHYNNVPQSLRSYDGSQLDPLLRPTLRRDEATISAVLSNLDGRLRQPLNLTDVEVKQLVTFLRALTDPSARNLGGIAPESVPSGLPVE